MSVMEYYFEFFLMHLYVCVSVSRYIYYFEIENPSIKVSYLSGLIALINEQLGAGAEGQSNPAVEAHYKNTLGETKLN
jgi:hypothetical protein